ncbi:MAG: PIN domain-containing protein [Bacteroidaceae bacterium]|nr:PIN domain-containing protein [Bacteroidaceae bacterium]
MLDTCVVIDLLTDYDNLERGALAIVSDPANVLVASFETMRELVVHYNNKRLLPKYWKSAKEMIDFVEDDLEIDFLPLRPQVGRTYANLRLNEEQEHHDPSDHIIISHAIAERITLLSSDTRFWYYRDQGLDLIEY